MKGIIKFNKFIFLFILFFLLGCAYSYAQDKIVAIVNNEVITQKDLDDFLNFMSIQVNRDYKGKELEDKLVSLKTDLLSKLIEDRLILQEANKEKMTVDISRVKAKIDDIRKRYNSDVEFQADLMRQGLTQADIEKRVKEQFLMFSIVEQKVRSKVVVNPEEVTSFYESNKKDMVSGDVRDIEVFALDSEDLASSFAYGLKSGKKMGDLAKRYPFTFNKITVREGEELKKEIGSTVSKLGIDEISNPIKIDNKFYVFKLDNIIPSRQLSLNEAQGKIYAYLTEEKSQEQLNKWLDEIKKNSYIKIK
jgi:parvulin-like peptidyl-prolyl isomerase